MIDTASIVIAVISLVGALGAALFTGYVTYLADERKRRLEIQAEVRKYSDPLLVTAHDLQDRILELLEAKFTRFDRKNENAKQNLSVFTCFLLAQFLAWTQILKTKTQFLAFSEDKSTSPLRQILYKISDELSTNRYGRNGWEFRLWPGHQLAIGELMLSEKDTGFLHPKGYHLFKKEFSGTFEPYFYWWLESIKNVLDAKYEHPESVPDQRLRRLQHILIDLIRSLDPTGQVRSDREPEKCNAAIECDCLDCNNVNLAERRRNRTRDYREMAQKKEQEKAQEKAPEQALEKAPEKSPRKHQGRAHGRAHEQVPEKAPVQLEV